MAFGARVLKTGIAVTLALYISGLLHYTPPVIAAVAALFAMQPSIYRSWRYFLEQLQTNTLGAVIAVLAGKFFSNDPIAIGIVCILVIVICLKIGMEQTVSLTLVTVIAVMEASGQWEFALNRFLLSLIGICSAFAINVMFFPPKPEVQFTKQIHEVFAKLSLLLRTVISNEIKEHIFRDEKLALEGALDALADKHKLLDEELNKLKKTKYRHTRQLVVYKQMLLTLQKGVEVLESVGQHYFQAAMGAETDERFDQQLEKLIKYHEHVLLKFDDKLKPDCIDSSKIEEENARFLHEMMHRNAEGEERTLRLTIVAAAMYDYGYQTGRLERLVEKYNKGSDEKELLDSLTSWFRR